MRRLTAWIGGVAGGVVAYRFWRRRPDAAAEPSSQPLAEDADERADELRAKLAENRASDEPSPVEPGEAPEEVEERRQRVHDQGRAALDQMKPPDKSA